MKLQNNAKNLHFKDSTRLNQSSDMGRGEEVGVGGQAEPKHNKYDKMSKVTCERQLIMLVSLNVPHVAHTHSTLQRAARDKQMVA